MKPFYNEFHLPTPKIRDAWKFALEAHGNQTYGSFPYEKHLADVVRCLQRFGFTPGAAKTDGKIEEVICAAWLHDVLEDTKVTRNELEVLFGDAVAETVARVSDEPGDTREERKAKTYSKIRGHFAATVVKLADRIANIEASRGGNEAQFRKYSAEQPGFRSSIYFPMLAEPMWNHLRLLTEREFDQKAPPPTQAKLFFVNNSEIEIRTDAFFNNGDLRIDDVAIGPRIKAMNGGKSDYERTLTVKREFKDPLLLAFLRYQFWGNSSFSNFQTWLSENGIPYETWSG